MEFDDVLKNILEKYGEQAIPRKFESLRFPTFKDIAPNGFFPLCDGYPIAVDLDQEDID